MQQPLPGQGKTGQDDLTKYVEELANSEEYPPGDAWVSITDAARITRTSEAMARRWVTSGRLPIKPGEYGIPPRTRLVRLSDVAKIRPIIDPTAAISEDTRKIDLASIPRQQAQIMTDYERILQETAALQSAVELFTTSLQNELQEGLDALEKRLSSQHTQLVSTLEGQLTTHREQQTRELEQISDTMTGYKQELERLAELITTLQNGLQEGLQQTREEVSQRLTTQDQAQQTRLEEATRRLEIADQTQIQQLTILQGRLAQAIKGIEETEHNLFALEERQQTTLENQTQALTKAYTTTIEQTSRNLSQELLRLEKDTATINSQIKHIITTLEQINTAITTTQATAITHQQKQEKRIDELTRQFEEEHRARRALEQQLTTLTQSVNALKKGDPHRK